MPVDLRSYLKQLETDPEEELLVINKELSPRFEIPAVLHKLEQEERFPTVLFQRVTGSDLPVVANIFASYRRHGLAIGTSDPKQMLNMYMQREGQRIPTKRVGAEDAPVKQVKWTGEQVDLRKLPIVTHHEQDSGPYITAGVLVTRDPRSGVYNAGVYRHELRGPRELGAFMQPFSHSMEICRRYGERGERMPAAICVGVHPALVIAANCRGALEDNELEAAGGLLGEPVEMVQAETLPIEVIARSELVIEGFVHPDRLVEDGPFGEYTGYYGSKQTVPLMEVTAITMRDKALFHDIFAGHPDHNAGPLATEANILRTVKQFVPSVTAAHSPRCGSFYHVYISIKKRVEGQGKLAGIAALVAHPNIKHVIVVDDDIDVLNEHEVLWAVATRFQADTGLTLSPFTTGATLDPTAYGEIRSEDGNMTTKMVIDATKPLGRSFPERVAVPRDVMERIDLRDLLQGRETAGPKLAKRGEISAAEWWVTGKVS